MTIKEQLAQAYREGYESGWKHALAGHKHRFTGVQGLTREQITMLRGRLETIRREPVNQRERPVHQHLEVHHHVTQVVAGAGSQVLVAQRPGVAEIMRKAIDPRKR